MQPGNPNWNDLRIFLEVARRLNFSKGAKALKMDVSTVSRHVAHLETCLNTPVFEREPLGLRLTPKGLALVERVQMMEAQVLSLTDAANSRDSAPSGTVRIGTMEGIASFYLAENLIAMRALHPGLTMELVTSANYIQVSHREADVFISFFPPEGRSLEVLPIGSFSLHLYAAAGYLDKHGTPATLDSLRSHEFVSYIDELVQLDTVRWLSEAIEQPGCVFHSTSMVAQMFAAAAGGGIVMLPAFMRAERFGLKRVLPDQAWLSRTFWLTVHRDLQYMPRIKAVTAYLGEIFARDHPSPPGVL